jgi:hypothetical protein
VSIILGITIPIFLAMIKFLPATVKSRNASKCIAIVTPKVFIFFTQVTNAVKPVDALAAKILKMLFVKKNLTAEMTRKFQGHRIQTKNR